MFILYILLYSLGCAAIPSLSSLILLIRSYQTIVYSPLQTTEEEEEKQVTVEIKEEYMRMYQFDYKKACCSKMDFEFKKLD